MERGDIEKGGMKIGRTEWREKRSDERKRVG